MISAIFRAFDELLLTLINFSDGNIWTAAAIMTCFMLGVAVMFEFALFVFDLGVQIWMKFCLWLLEKIITLLNM